MKIPAPLILSRPATAALIGGAALVLGLGLWAGRGADIGPMPETAAFHNAEGPVIYVQTHEVTQAEWNRCHDAGGCALQLRAPAGREDETFPATGVSWTDANEYIAWISKTTRHPFRLPTLDEWRDMAADVLPEKPDPIFTDPNLTWASAYLTESTGSRRLRPSGSYSVSADGIADLDGNVWEWTQSCVQQDTPSNRCPAFYAMGEHEAAMSYLIRDPARGGCAVGAPPAHLGLRLVSDTPPPPV